MYSHLLSFSLLLWLSSLSPSLSVSVFPLPFCTAFPITPQSQMGKKQLHIIRDSNLVLLALPNCDSAPCPRGPPKPGANPTVLRFRDSLGPSGALWTVPKKSSPRRKRSKSPAPLRGHSRNTLADSGRHQAQPPPWKHLRLCGGNFWQKVQLEPSEHRHAR